jgi:hypothetical protein
MEPAQPHIRCVAEAVSTGVKRSGREADHLPPSSAEIKNSGALSLLPPYAFAAPIGPSRAPSPLGLYTLIREHLLDLAASTLKMEAACISEMSL